MPNGIFAGGVYGELVLDGSKFSTTLLDAEKKMNTFEGKLKKSGQQLENAGKKLTMGVTAPIAGIATVAARSAIDFESAFAGVVKTVNATDEQLATLEKGIRDMAKEIPASASAIAEVGEAAGQLGIKTENILSFSRVMIDLGEATNLSATEAASSLAQLANITQMSQDDFDKLGSVIVALGNNMATTEADIVAMGQRLAGAGAQIGMSEAEIMSFAAALSSVGIEAEAGGSAMSKLMVDMKLETEVGGKNLENYARVAGMTAEQFTAAFKEDAAGAITDFVKGLGTMEEKGESAIKVLDDMGITEVRMRDALLRASGAGDLLTNAVEIGNKAWEENIALTKEAAQRYATTESQMKIAKNNLVDAAIIAGEVLVPHIKNLSEGLKNAANWFSNLNPKTQEAIVKFAGLAAAIGPMVWVAGKTMTTVGMLSKGLGGLAGTIAKAAGATTKIAGAAGSAATSVAAVGTKAGLATALLNPWTIGLVAAAGTAYLLHEELSERAIPTVDLFGEGVSEATKTALEGFLELEKEGTLALNKLMWSGVEVTEETKTSIVGTYEEMKNEVVKKLQEQKEAAQAEIYEMFKDNTEMSEKEKAEMVKIAGDKYDTMILEAEEGHKRITAILDLSAKEDRALTEREEAEILQIKNGMKEDGIRLLSETEKESLLILEKLKAESGILTAEMAAETVQNSKEQKDKTIAEAEEEYDERLKFAATLRSEGTEEAIKLADSIVEEAERQRDEAIEAAEEMHDEIIKEAKEQSGEHIDEVDWETGQIMSKWDIAVRWFKENPIIQKIVKAFSDDPVHSAAERNDRLNPIGTIIGRNASGTDNWRGGLTWVGEQGPEIIDLPKGSKVYSHEQSAGMVQRVEHSGMIRVEGVNSKGELIAIIEREIGTKIAQDNRRLPERASIIPIG